MARVFNGSNQYLNTSTIPISSWPITIAAWGYCSNYTANHSVVALGASNPVLNYMGLGFGGLESGDPIVWQPSDSGGASKTLTSTGYTINTWHHLCGITENNTTHSVYIDGGSKGTSSTDIAFPTLTDLSIGSLLFSGGRVWYLNGGAFWPAIWDVALSDDEVASLASGISPKLIRPDNLVFFLPLGGLDGENDNDVVGGLSLTANNSPTWSDDSPTRIIYPSRTIIGVSQGIITPAVQHARLRIGV